MNQDIAALSIVALVIIITIFLSVRNSKKKKNGDCNCGGKCH